MRSFEFHCAYASDTVIIDYTETVFKTTRSSSERNKPFPAKKNIELCSHGDNCSCIDQLHDCPAHLKLREI